VAIDWDADARIFHLRNGRMSYLTRVAADGTLAHLHFGAALAPARSYAHLDTAEFAGWSNRIGASVPLELPTPGSRDLRAPALAIEFADGSSVLQLSYVDHETEAGKPASQGLPTTYVEEDAEAATLTIQLADRPSGIEVDLLTTIFRDRPVLARSARIRNGGTTTVTVRCAMSVSLDLPDSGWNMLRLSGRDTQERAVVVGPVLPGRQSVGSIHGASGHQHNPFVALLRPETTEESGEAYGFALVYSGNFLAEAEADQNATTRFRMGINPEGFSWQLEPGEELALPEALLAWSADGLGGLSDIFHGLFRERLVRGTWRDRDRPIVLNSWEGAYFDFDEDRLVAMAASGAELGVELFVLDDGWFGARDDGTSSLGDWSVDRRKLPGGLERLAARIQGLGMGFGLWIEPEMVSPRSRLFEAHPEWAIGVPDRDRTQGRNQYVLDLSRREVVDHLTDVLTALLRSAPISYVKWDMNRTITQPFSRALPAARQGELLHRQVLGVYELYRRLMSGFPDVLFESCASGGGRYDPGMLAFAPQTWTSDDTDAVERLRIQFGTSIAYPLSSMVAHVSAVPNHQVGRTTPLATRAAVAFFGVFGYELDPTALVAAERREVAEQVAWYRERRALFQRGRFIRLRSPFERDGNETAWLVVDADAKRAVAGHYQVLHHGHAGPNRLRLRGLDPAATYRVTPWPARGDRVDRMNAGLRGGDELMSVGLFLAPEGSGRYPPPADFQARLFDLEALTTR
jgi:alpha-galactosidase